MVTLYFLKVTMTIQLEERHTRTGPEGRKTLIRFAFNQ